MTPYWLAQFCTWSGIKWNVVVLAATLFDFLKEKFLNVTIKNVPTYFKVELSDDFFSLFCPRDYGLTF